MGTTLSNGVYLPDEGERNCYAGLKVNWEILNQKVADISALQLAIAGALHREIVASLPTTDINPNTIYMILSGTSATENVYNEYMYVNNAWELIGTSATDLTNYYTKGDVDGLLLLKANASDLTSHTGDTTIHVTASDKTKWTNSANTHVLRLALSALTPSTSDNSFSNLDDSTALKVGDKVMDTAGVLFEVTAIDTQNSTFTIGTALIDLAQDSDVVHKSGDETVDGLKTFLKYITSNGSSTGDEYSSNARTNLWLMGNRDTEKVSGILFDSYRQNTAQGTGVHILGVGIKENSVRYEGCRFSWFYDNDNSGYVFSLRPTIQGTNQPIKYELGNSSSKWSTINGLNPGALSLPDLSNGIDISGYITNFGAGTVNEYTPVADGWISIASSGDAPIFIRVYNDYGFEQIAYSERNEVGGITGGTYTRYGAIMIPCIKNIKIYIIISPSTSVLVSAKFFPCQGNV